jgi:hypothetical protein
MDCCAAKLSDSPRRRAFYQMPVEMCLRRQIDFNLFLIKSAAR